MTWLNLPEAQQHNNEADRWRAAAMMVKNGLMEFKHKFNDQKWTISEFSPKDVLWDKKCGLLPHQNHDQT